MTWTRAKVRYRKVISRAGRFNLPKIHVATYSPQTKGWEPVCMLIRHETGIGMGYDTVEDDNAVTCHRCIKKGLEL